MMELWISLSSPDASTADRHWVLVMGRKSFRLPVRYGASNRLMRRVECWLEWNCRRVDVAY